jgi:hypothetical protein
VRLIVCRNRDLAGERGRKREELLGATERELARIAARVGRKHSILRSAAEIGMAVGAVLNARKMAKHFAVEIRDGHVSFERRIDRIEEEARLDGVYIIRTSIPAEHLDAKETVQAYKDLARVDIDQSWRLSRLTGWRGRVKAGKQFAAKGQRRCSRELEAGDRGGVRRHQFGEGSLNLERAAA